MSGSSRPTRTKTKPLRTNPIIFQLVSHKTRLLGVRMVPSRLPMTSPAVTAASTPESPRRSAGRYAANGMTTEIRTSTGGSSSRRRISPGCHIDELRKRVEDELGAAKGEPVKKPAKKKGGAK